MNIKIKKGLDLPLGGEAVRQTVDMRHRGGSYAVKPTDVVGFTPRLLVAEGEAVVAGQPLVCDKTDSRQCLTAPVSGRVLRVVRGEKRRLLAVVVERTEHHSESLQPNEGDVKQTLIDRGAWWMVRERPFGTIANPDHSPKGIFVSLIDTNPLAPDLEYALQNREKELEAGLQALATLAPLHVCLPRGSRWHFSLPGCTVHTVEGPHPAGNIGTQIAHISPINKGECVWTVGAQDVAVIGHLMLTGEYRPERTVSVAGPAAKYPKYYRVIAGCCLAPLVESQLMNPRYPALRADDTTATRIVSGSVLSGTQVEPDGHLGLYDHQVTLLAEGNDYEFMGWLRPGLSKFSFSKTFASGLLRPFRQWLPFSPTYRFNTNTHGAARPLLFTGNFEQVFPFDIYPLQLLKACIVGDLELQEQLGIYEVEPEDFALCEFIDPSKTEIQSIIRNALETLRKEATA